MRKDNRSDGPKNFVPYSFNVKVDNPTWNERFVGDEIPYGRSMKASEAKLELGKCTGFLEGKIKSSVPYEEYDAYEHMNSHQFNKQLEIYMPQIQELGTDLAPLLTANTLMQQGGGAIGRNYHLASAKGKYTDPFDDELMKSILYFIRDEYRHGITEFINDEQRETVVVKGAYTSSVGWSADIGDNCGRDVDTKLKILADVSSDDAFEHMKKGYPIFSGVRAQFDKPGKVRFGTIFKGRNTTGMYEAQTIHPFGYMSMRYRTVAAIPWLANAGLVTANQYLEHAKTPFLKKIYEQRLDVIEKLAHGKFIFCSDVPNNDQHMWPSVIDFCFDSVLSPELAEATKTLMRESPFMGAYTDMLEGTQHGLYDVIWYKIERNQDDPFLQNLSGLGITKVINSFQNLAITIWAHMKTMGITDPLVFKQKVLDDEILCLVNGDDCADGYDSAKDRDTFGQYSMNNPFAPREEEQPGYSGKRFIIDHDGRVKDMVFPISALFINTALHERRPWKSALRSDTAIGLKSRIESALEMNARSLPFETEHAVNLLLDVLMLDMPTIERQVEDKQKILLTSTNSDDQRQYYILRLIERLNDAGLPISSMNDLNWKYDHDLLRQIDPEAFEQMFIQYPQSYVDNAEKFIYV